VVVVVVVIVAVLVVVVVVVVAAVVVVVEEVAVAVVVAVVVVDEVAVEVVVMVTPGGIAGNSGVAQPPSRPARPSGAAPEGPSTGQGTARVFLRHSLELKKRPTPRVRRRWCSSTPHNHHPGQPAADTAFYTH
jgi:hypothetical protein